MDARLRLRWPCGRTWHGVAWIVTLAVGLPAGARPAGRESVVFVPAEPLEEEFRDEIPDALAPELAAAVERGKTFVGLSLIGEPALELDEKDLDLDPRDFNTLMDDLEGSGRGEEFDEIFEIIVRLEADVPLPEVGDVLAGLRVDDTARSGHFVILTSRGGFSPDQLKDVGKAPDVLYVEPNRVFRLADVEPNDVLFDDQWGLDLINAPAAWTRVTGSPALVAVIDTGIDHNHLDLAPNMWNNAPEANGQPDVDDDMNGYFDDVRGFDFYLNTPDPIDKSGHGSHCAGIIGAKGDNGKGVAGVCWDVRLMPLKVFNDETDHAALDDLAKAIDYAVEKEADVINMSLEAPVYGDLEVLSVLAQSVDAAEAAGVLIVAAAGNTRKEGLRNIDEHRIYPAAFENENVLTVLSVYCNGDPDDCDDEDVRLDDKSNYGKMLVDIGAPGVAIKSTFKTTPTKKILCFNRSGTSMAAPHVAGAAALLLGTEQYANAGAKTLKAALLDAATEVGSLDGRCAESAFLNLAFIGELPAPVDTAAASLELEGLLRYPVAAIGGETTGIIIRTPEGTYEIDVGDDRDLIARIQALTGRRVRVAGALIVEPSLERGERKIIYAESLRAADERP